ncbi:recombinase family protein [Varibaculum vaginae]|uniref:recombinase family protein n=1 Tax=Varibaculum vaginae TaxID=2364797 RepID=UPI000F085084|nr:recombinase family protein [Varibaculum vaginae]
MAKQITRIPTPVPAAKRTRVAAYARISEVKGNTPVSLSAQVSYYNQKIRQNPAWQFAGVYTDAGISGTTTSRPGFQRLLAACKRGEVDIILTKSISRFARNTVDLLSIVRDLRQAGIEVFFERENIRTLSGDGELMLSILASFAQEEAWSTSENVKWGIRKNFEKGMTNQMCVYGYIWTGTEFIINKTQAEAVRYIYKRFLQGARYSQIIDECAAHGWQAYWGGRFTIAAIKMILSQERYTGNTLLGKTFNPYPGHHGMKNTGQAPMFFAEGTNPVIIDQETFERAQIALAERTKQNQKCVHNQTLTVFSGRVWCGPCQRRANRCHQYRPQGQRVIYGWCCPAKAKGKPHKCAGGALREDRIKHITCLLTDKPEFSNELFDSYIERIELVMPGQATFILVDGREFLVRYKRGKTATMPTWDDVKEVTKK